MARFATPDAADQTAAMPTLVVFETRESGTNLTNSAYLRTTSAQARQSREDPALEIQLFQVIDPATGNPIQVLRVVLVVPDQTGLIAQSI
jgi:hypothetical protein